MGVMLMNEFFFSIPSFIFILSIALHFGTVTILLLLLLCVFPNHYYSRLNIVFHKEDFLVTYFLNEVLYESSL